MIKKIFGITTLLFLSIFLIMPVYALEPEQFEKITDVYPGDLDYRNSLVDWNGYNLDFNVYWSKQGGLALNLATMVVVENSVTFATLNTWVYNSDLDLYVLSMTSAQKAKILKILYSRTYDSADFIGFVAGTVSTDQFLFETRLTFKSLLNINLGSVFVIDSVYQSHSGLLSAFQNNIDIIGIENAIGGGQAEFNIARIKLDDELTHPIGTGSITAGRQFAQYNFISKFTNVHALNFNIVLSANSYDPPTANLQYYIYQLGFFADTQVILPDLNIDTDFQIYQPTICGILDLACVSRNLIGELSNTVYNRLGADSIASSIIDIYDTLFYPVYIIDNSAWQNAILAIYVMFPIGIIIMIIKRVT